MNTVTAVLILVVLFVLRFALPVGLMMLINWFTNRITVSRAH